MAGALKPRIPMAGGAGGPTNARAVDSLIKLAGFPASREAGRIANHHHRLGAGAAPGPALGVQPMNSILRWSRLRCMAVPHKHSSESRASELCRTLLLKELGHWGEPAESPLV